MCSKSILCGTAEFGCFILFVLAVLKSSALKTIDPKFRKPLILNSDNEDAIFYNAVKYMVKFII